MIYWYKYMYIYIYIVFLYLCLGAWNRANVSCPWPKVVKTDSFLSLYPAKLSPVGPLWNRSIYRSTDLSIFLSIHLLSIYLTYQCILSMYPAIYLSISTSISISPSPTIHASIHTSTHPSISLYVLSLFLFPSAVVFAPSLTAYPQFNSAPRLRRYRLPVSEQKMWTSKNT